MSSMPEEGNQGQRGPRQSYRQVLSTPLFFQPVTVRGTGTGSGQVKPEVGSLPQQLGKSGNVQPVVIVPRHVMDDLIKTMGSLKDTNARLGMGLQAKDQQIYDLQRRMAMMEVQNHGAAGGAQGSSDNGQSPLLILANGAEAVDPSPSASSSPTPNPLQPTSEALQQKNKDLKQEVSKRKNVIDHQVDPNFESVHSGIEAEIASKKRMVRESTNKESSRSPHSGRRQPTTDSVKNATVTKPSTVIVLRGQPRGHQEEMDVDVTPTQHGQHNLASAASTASPQVSPYSSNESGNNGGKPIDVKNPSKSSFLHMPDTPRISEDQYFCKCGKQTKMYVDLFYHIFHNNNN